MGKGKTPLISIIIPVYNTEYYLSECLDSVLELDKFKTEIIIINDGSTDNSIKIINQYQNKNSNIIVFNQPNKGQGAVELYNI